jgi:hypothetical protein
LTREQMIEMAAKPPKPDSERGGAGADPLGHHTKMSQVSASSAHKATQDSMKGARCYHRKKKEEVTVLEAVAVKGKVKVRRDNGETYQANISNLTRLS